MTTTKKQKTESTAPAAGKRIFDIAKPGTLPPADATARPVIVSNRVTIHDPMMVPSSNNNDAPVDIPAESPSAALSPKIVIKPLTDADTGSADGGKAVPADPADATKPAPVEPDTSASGAVDKDADGMIEPAEAKPASGMKVISPLGAADSTAAADIGEDTKKAAPADPLVTDSAGDGSNSDDPATNPDAAAQEEARLAADAKIQDEIDTLVAEKTYFLPINAVSQRRSRRVAILGAILILFLAALWLNMALDAGLVQIDGVEPLTHFFSNP